jgi:hypothetical protein
VGSYKLITQVAIHLKMTQIFNLRIGFLQPFARVEKYLHTVDVARLNIAINRCTYHLSNVGKYRT